MKAVQTTDFHQLELLLQNGADVKGGNGRAALETARDCGLNAIAQWLEQARNH